VPLLKALADTSTDALEVLEEGIIVIEQTRDLESTNPEPYTWTVGKLGSGRGKESESSGDDG